ncbi:MAG: C10 family peptidase [Tannerellaceae bacterium]|jgi:hypothetical protein|nr:C10 family peptidase [Tannerellaceae bacterium]
MDEALKDATNFLSKRKSNTPETRSAGEAIQEEFIKKSVVIRKAKAKAKNTISTLGVNKEEEVPVYLFDYQTKEGKANGFVIRIGDKRFGDGIFAYSETGNFISFDEGLGDFWLDRIDGLIYGVVNECVKMEPQIQTKGEDPWENPFGAEGYRRLKTSWRQAQPYNNYCPSMVTTKVVDDSPFGGKAPVGCVAVAMGQIMAYHSWPTQGSYIRNYGFSGQTNIPSVYYNWSQMTATFSAKNLSDAGKNMVANFLAEIGYKTRMQYDLGGSGTFSAFVPDAFKYMGYKNSIQYLEYSIPPAIVEDNISRNLPVYVGAAKPTGGGGHAFIINGYTSYSNSPVRHVYYVTAARQYENQDGWYTYVDNVFGYEYNYSIEFIYNIEPDYSKNGKINNYWRI